MIDSDNLRTASLYINNQLLSRGLLRDGQSIDFADPGRGEDLEETMGKIMSVVNDLILRRDRDAEHRESLSTTLRTVRAEALRQTSDIQRLHEKHAETQRKLNLGEAAENALRTQLKAAEASVHKLKEEAARTKKLVAETRSVCANEVRKRDRQIDGLKKAVSEAGRARGERKNPGITTITITGDIGAERADDSMLSTASDGYDLRQETNAFLAELAKGLSEENETLLNLVRQTSDKLKEMSGFEKGEAMAGHGDGHAIALQTNCQDLSNEIEAILEHLRTILTNPSFVPIEEVVVREEEINRLREGWVRMETRWKEAVHLIDGWRRRMALSGRPVNMEELKMGLRLSPVRVKDVEETSQGLGLHLSTLEEEEEEQSSIFHQVQSPSPAESLHLVPAPEYEEEEEEDASDSESSIFQDDVEIDELDVSEPNVQILQQSTMMDSINDPPLPPPPQISPLKDNYSAGNRGATGNALKSRKRPGDFTTIVEENTCDLIAEAPPPPPHVVKPQQSPQKRMRPSPREAQEPARPISVALSDSASSLESVLLVKPTERPVSQASSRTTQASRVKAQPPKESPSRQAATHSSRSSATSTKSRQQQDENRQPSADMPPPPKPALSNKQETEASQRLPRRTPSKLPLPRNNAPLPPPQQSPLTMATIAAKLAASEREADAARVRAKLKAARLGKRTSLAPSNASTATSGISSRTCSGESYPGDPSKKELSASRESQDENGLDGGASVHPGSQGEDQPVLQQSTEEKEKPRKRERRASKVASRRRSTLNPWELQSLIAGDVNVPPSPAR